MYIICFYWQGDRWQSPGFSHSPGHVNLQANHLNRIGQVNNALASKYVNNLYKGVSRFAEKPFEFICYTNENLNLVKGVIKRPFSLVTVSGVLPRLYMFSKEAGLFGQQVLCLDIDVVILGSLKPLQDYKGLFCARSKFKHGQEYKLDGDVMSFKACKETEKIFWDPFIKDVEEAVELTKGRERYWTRHVAGDFADRWEKQAPGSVISYKWHGKNRAKIDKACIMSCHGFPRPHQIKENWVQQYWN